MCTVCTSKKAIFFANGASLTFSSDRNLDRQGRRNPKFDQLLVYIRLYEPDCVCDGFGTITHSSILLKETVDLPLSPDDPVTPFLSVIVFPCVPPLPQVINKEPSH